MIKPKGFRFEEYECKHRENREGNHFLNYLELHERKRAAIFFKSDAVSRHLKNIFKKRDAPANQNNAEQTQMLKPGQFFKLQVPISGEGHKRIGKNK